MSVTLCRYACLSFPTGHNVTTSESQGLYFSITKFATITTGDAKYTIHTQTTITNTYYAYTQLNRESPLFGIAVHDRVN